MTEQPTDVAAECPAWCRNSVESDAARAGGQEVDEVHAHVTVDVVVGDSADPVVVRMVQLAGSDVVRVVVGQHVVDLSAAHDLAHALLRLTDAAQPAEAGFGFVEVLTGQAGVGTGELALAAGLDVERVRAQRAGGQVLSVAEFDRLALAAARLLPLRATVREADADEDGIEAVADDVAPQVAPHVAADGPFEPADAADLSAFADMTELAALADGPDNGRADES
jgi:hypothetical protein